MDIFDIDFSRIALYKFVFIGIILFFFLRAIRYILPIAFKKRKNYKTIAKYLPIFELFTWTLFFIWALQYFMLTNRLVAIVIIILLAIIFLWVIWAYVIDYISGIYIRFSDDFKIGNIINFEGNEGKISALFSRSLELEIAPDKVLVIPYSKLAGKFIVKLGPHTKETNRKLVLKLSNVNNFKFYEATINKILVNQAWVSLKKMPQIELISEESQYITISIFYYSIDNFYVYKIEQTILAELKEFILK